MARRRLAAGVVLAAAGLGACLFAQGDAALPWQKAAADAPAVRFEYPEQVTVTAGKPSMVELHFRVRDGLHINSHTPFEKSFIRTDLVVVEPPGVKVAAVDFPQGGLYALRSMPNEKLSVYTGEVVLRAHLTASAGEHLVQAGLRYQACDTDSCYPPKTAPAAFDIVAK